MHLDSVSMYGTYFEIKGMYTETADFIIWNMFVSTMVTPFVIPCLKVFADLQNFSANIAFLLLSEDFYNVFWVNFSWSSSNLITTLRCKLHRGVITPQFRLHCGVMTPQ